MYAKLFIRKVLDTEVTPLNRRVHHPHGIMRTTRRRRRVETRSHITTTKLFRFRSSEGTENIDRHEKLFRLCDWHFSIWRFRGEPPFLIILFQELQEYLDTAEEGVIYFSLGSTFKSKFITESKRKVILDTLGQLPYRVLWKFESTLEDKPENVKIMGWFPQQAVLRTNPLCSPEGWSYEGFFQVIGTSSCS